MGRQSWAVLVILLMGCGDNWLAPDRVRSGRRLRAVFVQEPGGVRVFERWYDRLLDVECTFTAAVDGGYRCVPDAVSVGVFVDADCRAPLFEHVAGECVEPPRFARLDLGGCSTRLAGLWQLGAAVEVGTVYRRTDAGCTAEPANPAYSYLRAEAAIALDALAAATEVRSPVGRRLKSVELEAEDGARMPWSIEDTTLGTACFAGFWGDGDETRCFPDYLSTDHFADDACAAAVATVSSACAATAPGFVAAFDYEPTTCTVTARYFERGAPVDADGLYLVDGDACVATDPGDVAAYAVGAAVALGQLAPVIATLEDGPARLQRRVHRDEDGALLRVITLVDPDLGACTPDLAEDGVVRCIPTPPTYVAERFRDPACTEAAPIALRYQSACFADEEARFVVDGVPGDDPCAPWRLRVRHVGAPVEGPRYGRAGDMCVEIIDDGDRAFELGEVVPAGDLVAFERVVE